MINLNVPFYVSIKEKSDRWSRRSSWNVLIIFSNDCMSIVSTHNVLYPVVAYILASIILYRRER